MKSNSSFSLCILFLISGRCICSLDFCLILFSSYLCIFQFFVLPLYCCFLVESTWNFGRLWAIVGLFSYTVKLPEASRLWNAVLFFSSDRDYRVFSVVRNIKHPFCQLAFYINKLLCVKFQCSLCPHTMVSFWSLDNFVWIWFKVD